MLINRFANVALPLRSFRFLWVFVASLWMFGCEQQIEVELPTSEAVYVVEGKIESGAPPIVFVGLAQGYFDPVDASSVGQSFLSGAIVHISIQGQTIALDELCTGDLPPEALEQAAELLGFPAAVLGALDLCVYTSFDGAVIGQSGNTYELDVSIDEKELHAKTEILPAIPLDSLRWAAPGSNDTLGLLYASFTDPDSSGNAYRWYAKRTNVRPMWDPLAGEIKDGDFVAPLGSVFDDSFFNGLSFEFGTFRGSVAGSTAWDDDFSNAESGYFKSNDTVAVRFCAIDADVYDAIASYENLILSQGSPFSLPANMESNIDGGIGLWAGYGIWQDTVICQQ
ncbi:MAG: DUF4249 family protein [Flavobacteriales bacterium]|nr:DUF4249 family protein [Flavobacteriales bacterium]